MTEPGTTEPGTPEPGTPGAGTTGAGAIVTLQVWRVEPRRLPVVLWSLVTDRLRIRRAPGVRFLKLLGTGRGRDFGPGADLTRWAALTVSDGPAPVPAMARAAVATCVIRLAPIASRGTWAGREPFTEAAWARWPPPRTDQGAETTDRDRAGGSGSTGEKDLILVLTRARLRIGRAAAFWRAIGPVTVSLRGESAVRAAFGMGEAPIGFQGTVSIWSSPADIVRFAYRQPEHAAVVARTPRQRWYAEELFARFSVLGIEGDRDVIGWRDSVSGGGAA